MAAHTMFLVTADHQAVDALSRALQAEGFETTILESGKEIPPDGTQDLVMIVLPDGDALAEVEVCRDLRGKTDGYIMLVTEQRSEAERIAALDTGIDDYVSMPVSPFELLARVRGHLRRVQAMEGAGGEQYKVGCLTLNALDHKLNVSGRDVPVTHKELLLLQVLLRAHGQLVPRDTLFREVWGPDWYGDVNVLAVYVRRLRTKLGEGPECPHIENVRGVGYRLTVKH